MRGAAIASIAVLTLAGCGPKQEAIPHNTVMADNGVLVSDTVVPPNETVEANAGNVMADPINDGMFVNAAASSDLFEIESGKAVAARSTNADVKAFAAMLIKDHTASTAALKPASALAHPVVTPVAELDPGMQAKVDALKAADAASVDRLFIAQQIEAYTAALKLLKDYARNGASKSLRDFANKTQVPVEMHLAKAQAMQK